MSAGKVLTCPRNSVFVQCPIQLVLWWINPWHIKPSWYSLHSLSFWDWNHALTRCRHLIMVYLDVWTCPLASAWRIKAYVCLEYRKLKSVDSRSWVYSECVFHLHGQSVFGGAVPFSTQTHTRHPVCVCQVACSSDNSGRFIDLISAYYIRLSRRGHLGL